MESSANIRKLIENHAKRMDYYLALYTGQDVAAHDMETLGAEERSLLEKLRTEPACTEDQIRKSLISSAIEVELATSPSVQEFSRTLDIKVGHQTLRQLLKGNHPLEILKLQAGGHPIQIPTDAEPYLRSAAISFINSQKGIQNLLREKFGISHPQADRQDFWRQVYQLKRDFKQKIQPTSLQYLPEEILHPNEINKISVETVKMLGLQTDMVEIRKLDIPFPGLHIDFRYKERSVILIRSSVENVFGLSAVLHEIGHAVDHISWQNGFVQYYFSDPLMKEAFALGFQKLPESEDFVVRFLNANRSRAVSRWALKYRRQQLLYTFLLMDIDWALWNESLSDVDDLAEYYSALYENSFGYKPLTPYGFCGEMIHLQYPFYMPNYFCAELLSETIHAEDLTDLQKAASWRQSLYSLDDSQVLETMESAAAVRAMSLFQAF